MPRSRQYIHYDDDNRRSSGRKPDRDVEGRFVSDDESYSSSSRKSRGKPSSGSPRQRDEESRLVDEEDVISGRDETATCKTFF